MSKSKLTIEFLQKHYVQDGKSTVEIAKMLNTFPETIRRALKKHNIPVRTRSKASKNFYNRGGENARKGYKFTEEERENASIAAKEYWLSENSKEAREKIAKASRKYWEGVSKEEKEEIINRLHQACREASFHGSRTEHTLAELLQEKHGFKVLRGMTELAGIGNLEVDIAIPEESIIIEVDGITHFKDVFSDNRYQRAQGHDKKKNDVMTGAGWSVIRVQLKCERYSRGSCLVGAETLARMIRAKEYEHRGVSYVEMN